LVVVFLPIAFQSGTTGILFREFAIALAGSVAISAFVALTLSPAFFLATAEQLLSGQAAAVSLKGLRIEGDAEVAQQLVPLIQLMRSRLSPFGQAASQSWPVQAAQRAAHFAVHETDVLATRPMVEAQQQALQALRDRIARFEKRLQAFESRTAP
ncbi:MAG: hypothetical protein EBR88_03160, partial [Betaproteobacteria bacterium]|nr:hypothetical protein [Betaproteobacteria bacterium]